MSEQYNSDEKQMNLNEFSLDKVKKGKTRVHGFTIEQTDKELIISWRGYKVGYPMGLGVIIVGVGMSLISFACGSTMLFASNPVVASQQAGSFTDNPVVFTIVSIIPFVLGFFSFGIFLLSRIYHEIYKLNRITVNDEKIRLKSMTTWWWGTREFHVDEIEEIFIHSIKRSNFVKVRLQNRQKPVVLVHNMLELSTARFLVEIIIDRLDM